MFFPTVHKGLPANYLLFYVNILLFNRDKSTQVVEILPKNCRKTWTFPLVSGRRAINFQFGNEFRFKTFNGYILKSSRSMYTHFWNFIPKHLKSVQEQFFVNKLLCTLHSRYSQATFYFVFCFLLDFQCHFHSKLPEALRPLKTLSILLFSLKAISAIVFLISIFRNCTLKDHVS